MVCFYISIFFLLFLKINKTFIYNFSLCFFNFGELLSLKGLSSYILNIPDIFIFIVTLAIDFFVSRNYSMLTMGYQRTIQRLYIIDIYLFLTQSNILNNLFLKGNISISLLGVGLLIKNFSLFFSDIFKQYFLWTRVWSNGLLY